MNVRDFNLLNQSGKKQTKLIVVFENDLLKVGSVWTVKEVDECVTERLEEIIPYKIASSKKESDKRYNFIDTYRKKIIKALERKNVR